MGMIQEQEESGQELYTRDHGTVRTEKLQWMDGGFHIVLGPDGVYQHLNGLPIKNEAEIHAAFGRDDEGNCPNEGAKQKCLNWFRNRHEQAGNPPRPIGFNAEGIPVFGDGTVVDFSDLYAFWKPILPNGKPNPVLITAIAALKEYNDYHVSGQAPKELRAAAPLRSEEEVKDAFKTATKPEAPDPLKYSPKARSEAKGKVKKAAARAAKTKAARQVLAASGTTPGVNINGNL